MRRCAGRRARRAGGTSRPARRRARIAISVTAAPRSCRYGGRTRTKIACGGLAGGRDRNAADQSGAHVRRQRQRPPSPALAGHTDNAVVPVDVRHGEGRDLSGAQAQSTQQQQDRAVASAAGSCLVHRGQHALGVVGRENPGQRRMLPFPDGRHGALDAGRNDAAAHQEAQQRPRGGRRIPTRRGTEPADAGLHERCNRWNGDPGDQSGVGPPTHSARKAPA